jgi:DNA polymerase II small subunit
MMRDRILNFLISQGALAQSDAVDYILAKKEPIHYVEGIFSESKGQPLVLTVEHLLKVDKIAKVAGDIAVMDVEQKHDLKPTKPPKKVRPETHFGKEEEPLDNLTEVVAVSKKDKLVGPLQELPKEIKIFSDITGNSTCEGTIGDFKLYFNDRLKTLRKIIKEKRQMMGARELSKVKRADGNIKIIGMVSEIRTTKKGNKMITLEDEKDTVRVLLTKDKQLASDPTVLDEVLGIIGEKTRDGNYLLASELVRPEINVRRKINRSQEEALVAFASDIHCGSDTFLKDEFLDFLGWLNGKSGRKKELASKVKYVVIPGDIVDGIGIYPDQEEELAINDIYGQYEELARLIAHVPEHIKVIMLPGNHDAVRPAEPQPTFPQEIRDLYPENVIFVGNPSYLGLSGVELLAYHGRSMDDFIKALPSLDYSHAIRIMIEMLKKRHLVPIYGGRTPIAPEHKDYLVIDKIPDIFVTGHGHSTGMSKFRNVTLINASCWQSQTSFQKMHNFIPDPAKVPIFNLHTGEAGIIDFS